MANSVEILIRAIDQASTTFDQIGQKGMGMSKNLESACVKVGAALTGIGISAKLMADDVNKAFLSFEKGLTELKGLGVVGDDLEKLKQKALDLSKTMPLGLEDITKSMYNMVSSGSSATEVYNSIGDAAKLAVAGSADLDTVTNSLISALDIFESQGLSAADATAIMAKAVGDGKFELDELLQEMMKNISVASNLGISFQELAGYNVAIQSSFTDASEAGTALRGVFMNLTEQKTIDLLNEMGISVSDNAGNFRGMIPIMQDLNEYFEEHRDLVDKNTKLGQLFGSRSITAATALMREASAAGTAGSRLDDMVASMGDASFITSQFNAKMEDTGNKLQIATNKMDAAKVALGEAMVPSTMLAADAMSMFAGILENLPDPMQGAIGAFLTFGQALIPLGPLLIALPTIMSAVGPAATILGGVMTGLGGVLSGSLTVGATGAAAGLAGVGITIGTLIPIIGAIVAAVIAFKLAWDSNFLGIQDTVKKVADFLKDRFKVVQDTFGKVADSLGKAGGKILDAFMGLYEKLDGVFKKLSGGTSIMEVFTKVVTALGIAWDIAWKLIGNALSGAVDGIANGIGGLIDWIGRLVDWFGKLMDNPIVNWLVNAFGGAVEWVTGKLDTGISALDSFNKSLDEDETAVDALSEGLADLGKMASDTGEAFGVTGDEIKTALSSVASDGGAALKTLEEEFIKNGGTSEQWKNIIAKNSAEINAAWAVGSTKDLKINADAPPAIAPGTTPAAGTPANQAGKWFQTDSGNWYYTDERGVTQQTTGYGVTPSGATTGTPSKPAKELTSTEAMSDGRTKKTYSDGSYEIIDSRGNVNKYNPNAGQVEINNTAPEGPGIDARPSGGWGDDPRVTVGSQGKIASSHFIPNDLDATLSSATEGVMEFRDANGELVYAIETTAANITYLANSIGDLTDEEIKSTYKMVNSAEKQAETIESSTKQIEASYASAAEQTTAAAETMKVGVVDRFAAMRAGAANESETMNTAVRGSINRMNITSAAEAANMAETIKAKFAEMSAAARNVSTGGGGSSGGSYTSGACPFGSNTVQTGANLPVAGSWNGSIETQTNVQMGSPNYGFRSKAYQQAYNVLPCAASGGEVTDEGVVLVGEQGPELIKLPRGAKVSSTHQTRERIGGDQKASGQKNEVHLHIGTFVGDQAGLRKLQRLLEGMRISENVRKGVTV